MNKIIIGYALIITITLITALIGVLKRKAMLNLGETKFTSPMFWIKTLINPYIIGIFIISILMFVLTLAAFSLLTADKVLVISWTLTIPSFLVTILFNYILLSEKINPEKYMYVIILFISVIIGIIGAIGYFRN